MEKVYFISGIDTGVGKTVATGLLAKFLAAEGKSVITMKMVQTGNVGFSEDLQTQRAIQGKNLFEEDKLGLTAPQIFKFPASPALASKLEGKKVELEKINAAVATLSARYEVTLIEAAGGLCVPLTEELLTVDYAAAKSWPIILVTCGRLGSVNHTLLSLEAIKSRNLKLSGVIYNYHPEADAIIDNDSFETIKKALKNFGFPERIIRIPKVGMNGEFPLLDFSEIFSADENSVKQENFYSLKMRASKKDDAGNSKHLSGAERLLNNEYAPEAARNLTLRALNHSLGSPDLINLKLEKIPKEEIKILPALPVSQIAVANAEEGMNKALELLVPLMQEKNATDAKAILLKLLGASYPLRGALLYDVRSKQRVDCDKEKGVRVTYLDALPSTDTSSEKNHFREALVLASKVANAPGIIGELCVSDDPDYETGYVASKSFGYVRIMKIKKKGDRLGGRVFLFDSALADIKSSLNFLCEEKTLIKF